MTPGDVQEAAQQRRRAPDLVGLHGQLDQLAQLRRVVGDHGAEVRPGVAGVRLATGGGVVPGERGRLPAEDQPVRRGHEAQRGHRAERVRLMALEHAPARPAGLDVVGGRGEQVGVERRADVAAQLGLPPQGRGRGGGWRRLGQATSAGSSLPARRSRPRCTAAMNFDRLTSSVLRISSA